jgi:hypothetical protein
MMLRYDSVCDHHGPLGLVMTIELGTCRQITLKNGESECFLRVLHKVWITQKLKKTSVLGLFRLIFVEITLGTFIICVHL